MNDYKIPFRNRIVNIAANVRTHSDQWLVFLHGLGCTKAAFDTAFAAKELEDFSLCAFDFLGFGDSDAPNDLSYELNDQAEILIALINQLSIKKVHLVAHSMGGAIGLLATEKLPELVSFINVEGNLLNEDCGIVSRKIATQKEEDFIRTGFHEFVQSLEATKQDDLLHWAKWCREGSPIAFHRSACSLVTWSDSGNLFSIFQAIQNKAYIRGEENLQLYLQPHLDGWHSYVIPASGHFMMLENARSFYTSIAHWLKQSK
ncbi:Pimeloyl-ACP methyl ester carboxylesterase [Seinonella peptonophila]|uniref:Pimeloyl-ACP methyl ester carboxylesterase n=2 Tax=Seinonella peptonophila TaxID=112248 RepID=A0A1M4SLR0_9BACL|nr:Pimeloyl-ACP methyl ester carboxylesterase [Seinonella peptonophila]